MSRFTEALNEQIAYEFAASQQYIAIAVHYDSETLPQLAAHFYQQAIEERNHAMMMVQYLLDAGEKAAIPGVEVPRTDFADTVAPVALALDQERRVSSQINALAGIARETGDYAGEQFMQWFIKEQVEEVLHHHHRVVPLLDRLAVEVGCELRQRLGVVVDGDRDVLLRRAELVGDLLVECIREARHVETLTRAETAEAAAGAAS